MSFLKRLFGGKSGRDDVLANEPVGPNPNAATPNATGADADGSAQSVYEEIADLVRRGRKIEAIRRLREETGCGLAEAKHAMDRRTWPSLLPPNES